MSTRSTFFNPILIGPIAVLISLWILKPLAARLRLLDHPGGRKIHASPTPVIGGIALFIGFTVALLCDGQFSQEIKALWFFSALILFIGVTDDRHGLSARMRLLVQTLVASGLVLISNIRIETFGHVLLDFLVNSHVFSLVFTVLVIIAFINAINMLDGLDGLVGGIALGEGFLLWLLSCRLMSSLQQILSVFLCLMLVFLVFNVPFFKGKQARVFLGDAGSTFIAFFLVCAGIMLSQHTQETSITPITILWCLLFPFMDLLSVCIIRKCIGKPCFQAGHEHIHHLLIRNGLSRHLVSAVLCLFSLSLGLIGLVLAWLQVSENVQLILLLMLISYYLLATFRIYKREVTVTSTTCLDGTSY